jgi:hypothetical protein
MPITRSTYPERVLIVLNSDGTLKGGHQEAIETIADGADVLSVKQLAAAPLDAGTLAAVLPDHASLLAQVLSLTAERDAAVAAKAEAEETALAEKSALETQLAALNAQLHPTDANGFEVLSAVQVRLALRQSGITAAMVDAVIAAIPDPLQRDIAATYWEYATEMHRDHPLIGQLAAALGLTDEQVDTMWRGSNQ